MANIIKYPRPMVTVDIVIFSIQNDNLKVLLIKRNIQPYKGSWALPGGFVHIEEDLDSAAKRELEEETGVKDIYLEQLYTFGDTKRDPRGRVITVAYFALIKSEDQKLDPKTDVSDADWFLAYKPLKLAFDHSKILDYALKRLQWKLEYTTVAFQFLPKKFTLTQLQKIYEIILNKTFDKRNFRKKIISLEVLEETGDITKGVSHRPAKLFQCKTKIGEILELI
ncbi:NUDIX hydrolase [Candidatus Woesearchaeota archaeon]|nr:NUDIX hydrolase [Candidatus Woesearchaeota archaeon]